MNDLGILYDQGRGVAQDYAQARQWYQKAAEAGDPLGMNNLGVLYEQGRGVARDYAQARQWYQKAAEAGNAVAMTNLGDSPIFRATRAELPNVPHRNATSMPSSTSFDWPVVEHQLDLQVGVLFKKGR